MNNIDYDFKTLAFCSEMAQNALQQKKKIEVVDIYDPLECIEYNFNKNDVCFPTLSKLQEQFSFHPNGNTGCIHINDDYIFDIRCNHLIWIEGECEGVEFWWKEKDFEEEGYPKSILICGNHKGYFKIKMIVIHNE